MIMELMDLDDKSLSDIVQFLDMISYQNALLTCKRMYHLYLPRSRTVVAWRKEILESFVDLLHGVIDRDELSPSEYNLSHIYASLSSYWFFNRVICNIKQHIDRNRISNEILDLLYKVVLMNQTDKDFFEFTNNDDFQEFVNKSEKREKSLRVFHSFYCHFTHFGFSRSLKKNGDTLCLLLDEGSDILFDEDDDVFQYEEFCQEIRHILEEFHEIADDDILNTFSLLLGYDIDKENSKRQKQMETDHLPKILISGISNLNNKIVSQFMSNFKEYCFVQKMGVFFRYEDALSRAKYLSKLLHFMKLGAACLTLSSYGEMLAYESLIQKILKSIDVESICIRQSEEFEEESFILNVDSNAYYCMSCKKNNDNGYTELMINDIILQRHDFHPVMDICDEESIEIIELFDKFVELNFSGSELDLVPEVSSAFLGSLFTSIFSILHHQIVGVKLSFEDTLYFQPYYLTK